MFFHIDVAGFISYLISRQCRHIFDLGVSFLVINLFRSSTDIFLTERRAELMNKAQQQI